MADPVRRPYPHPARPRPGIGRRLGRWRRTGRTGRTQIVSDAGLLVAIGFVTVVLGACAGSAAPSTGAAAAPAPASAGPGDATVVRVVDGDTLVVDIGGREENVRLIGIDTPESTDPRQAPECFGTEAADRTEVLVPPGTAIRLERDVEARDRYDRLLAYVFRQSDDLFVNLAMVQDGFAEVLTIAPNVAYRQRFTAAVNDARAEGRGLWSSCPPAG